MSQKKYWKSIEELENTPAHQKMVADEFQDELPVGIGDTLLNAQTPRRDFLKYLGFTTLAATVAASCEMPIRKAIPFAIKPDAELETPGVPNYYASTFIDNGDYCSVVVKTREGRPIMIEGNTMSPITKGGVTARVVAATLSLYDATRLRGPLVAGKAVEMFDKVDAPITSALAAAGGQVVLLTGSIISPTTKDVIAKFLAKYPNSKHVTYDTVSYSGMLLANESSFGRRALPSYHFDNADTIFSLGADFLGTWLSPAEFGADYAKNRKVSVKNLKMSKHYQVEGMMSMTGMNADERATARPSEYGKVAAALYAAVTSGTAPSFSSKKLNTIITTAAADLKKGKGLVVCGSNDTNVQTIVNAINSSIGAYGSTINWGVTSNYRQGIDADMVALTDAMNTGQVGALLIHGVNPVYDYFDGKKFADGLKKVKTTISFNDRKDETTELCAYAVPDHHWLESWGDAEPKSGYYSFMQPTIAPLFKTRAFQDSLLKWAGEAQTYHDYWQQYWVGKLGSQKKLDEALQNGIAGIGSTSTATVVAAPVAPKTNDSAHAAASAPTTAVAAATPSNMSGASFSGNVADAIAKTSNAAAGKYELIVYPSIAIGHGGAWSNNPWLLETPDPVTRATWDNYVMMSPTTAKEFDAELTGINQVETHKRVVKVKVGSAVVDLPVMVTPGMHDAVIAIAMGYGRSKNTGRAAANTGKNAFPLVTFAGGTFSYANAASIEKTAEKYPVAITQTHMSSEGRPIVHEYTFDDFKKDPNHLIKERNAEIGHYTALPWEHHEGHENDLPKVDEEGYRVNGTLYPQHDKPGIHWGMSIDLSSCTACAACVVACQAENNVSVVGKAEVLKAQDMSWIRIDRYFSGDPKDPDSIQAIFQPMLCQHCDNAPCENVCPVSATNHSSEGLNQMAYNRCIGTKYCANNCPYKVRRFNWFDFNGADSFKDNLYEDGRRDDINDDLTRMVLNPDVTVRSRGVMEKCSFCVQRLQDAKLHAKKAGRPMKDGEAKTACQVACTSNSIVFGNVNDKTSAIYKMRHEENAERVFYVLEHLHTLPNINYLSKIRNASESVMGDEKKDGMMNEHI